MKLFAKSAAVKIFLVCCCLVAVRAESDESYEDSDVGDARMVNAEIIPIKYAPYTVQLRNPSAGQYCGGTLVTLQHVVTAAHCFGRWTKEQIVVHAGVSTRSDETGETRNIAKLTIHPRYKEGGFVADVAVLKLDRPLIESNNIKVVQGLCSQPLTEQNRIQVSGWGLISENGPVSEELRTASMQIAKCSSDEVTWVCTAPSSTDSCTNDSGGPGIFNSQLCAVVSHGYGCARPDQKAVYVNVHAVRDFINDCIKN